ncbi:hypothetical protein [Actinoplanes sp. NPDC048796]
MSVVAGGALVLGLAAPASAFSDSDVSGCLDFKHSSPFFSTKQKVVGTNTCGVGPFGFRVYNWSRISSETSPCLRADARRSAGWEWTKGRGSYAIISC